MSSSIPASHVRIKRAYEAPAPEDGARILIDRLWPRGVRKDAAALDLWLKGIGPSTELRKWFGHEPSRWAEFRRRYADEIAQKPQLLAQLRDIARQGVLTMVYSAHDEQHNDALVLQELILHPPTATGP